MVDREWLFDLRDACLHGGHVFRRDAELSGSLGESGEQVPQWWLTFGVAGVQGGDLASGGAVQFADTPVPQVVGDLTAARGQGLALRLVDSSNSEVGARRLDLKAQPFEPRCQLYPEQDACGHLALELRPMLQRTPFVRIASLADIEHEGVDMELRIEGSA